MNHTGLIRVGACALLLAACSSPRTDFAVDGGSIDAGVDAGTDAGHHSPVGMPCSASDECGGGTCVPGADGGGTCTVGCSSASDCVAGWTCGPQTGVSGNVCLCSPDIEVCDGKDNDCDGVVDNEATADESCIFEVGTGGVCAAGACTCPNFCAGRCADLQTDNTNCGVCGRTCASTETCTAGNCTAVMTGCVGGTPPEVEANCVCQSRVDCQRGNSAKWACTPFHQCVQICTTSADCPPTSVCEDLICRPAACGEDSECSGGLVCRGGRCQIAATDVASCKVFPPETVINEGGTRVFSLATFNAAGHAIPFAGTVTWGQTSLTSVSTPDSGTTATFTSLGMVGGTGTVTASVGSVTCTAAVVHQFAASVADLRVVVIDQDSSAPLAGVTVVVQGGESKATTSDGSVTFNTAASLHTVSVFDANHRYVTVVGTSASDLLIALPSKPHRAKYSDKSLATDFKNLSNLNGTSHVLCAGASLHGNLIDADLLTMLGWNSVPMTIALGTGTPYGPYDVPEGVVDGLGATIFNTDSRYSIEVPPSPHDLWSIGGNAVIGDVLRIIGPILNGNGTSTDEMLDMILPALLPLIGVLESGVYPAVVPSANQMVSLSAGNGGGPLVPDTLPRLRVNLHLPTMGTFVDTQGTTQHLDAVLVEGGPWSPITGFVPQGMTFGIDQISTAGGLTPDGLVDPVGSGAEGQLPLRLAPRHGGLEHSPWGLLAMASNSAGVLANDLCMPTFFPLTQGASIPSDFGLTARVVHPAAIPYNEGAVNDLTIPPFLDVPGLPERSGRTVTLPAAVTSTTGAVVNRLDVGTPESGWILYFPSGTTTLSVPSVPSGFTDPYDPMGAVVLTATSLGVAPAPTYDALVQFDGVDLDDFSSVTDGFSLREVPR